MIRPNYAGAKSGVAEGEGRLAKAEADLQVSRAKLDVAEADVQRVSLLLQYAQVRVPFDGLAVRRGVAAGDFVSSADRGRAAPLFVLA